MMKYQKDTVVYHTTWGYGIVLHSQENEDYPLQVEFYREPHIKTFYGNAQKQISVSRYEPMDRFKLGDRVECKQFGPGRIVQKNNTTQEVIVLFNSVQDNCKFIPFKMEDPDLHIEVKSDINFYQKEIQQFAMKQELEKDEKFIKDLCDKLNNKQLIHFTQLVAKQLSERLSHDKP